MSLIGASAPLGSGAMRCYQMTTPDSLKYAQPMIGPFGTRKEVRLPASASTYSNTGERIIRFFFNNDGLIDCRRGQINFDCTITGSNGTYYRLAQGVWSMFNRVVLKTGQTLEDIREYNLLHSLIFEMYRDEEIADVIGPSCYGYAVQADRETFAATTHQYAMPLLVGFFHSGVIPNGLFHVRLCLELYMENDWTRFVESDSTSAITVTLTNVYFHYEELKLDPSAESAIIGAAMSGIKYPFKSFTHYIQPVISTRQNLLIPHSSVAIDAFIHVMRRSDNQNVATTDDKFLTWLYNDAVEYKIKINNEFYPAEPTQVQNAAGQTQMQSYIQFLRMLNKWKMGGVYQNPPCISIDEYVDDKFIIINQLEAFPGDGLANNISTDRSGNNVYLDLLLGAAPPVATQLDTFVQHSCCIDFRSGNISSSY